MQFLHYKQKKSKLKCLGKTGNESNIYNNANFVVNFVPVISYKSGAFTLYLIFTCCTTVPPKVSAVANKTIALIAVSTHLQFFIEEANPPVHPEDIQWMFAGTELQEDGEHVVFSADRLAVTITNLSLSDEGIYSLMATNLAGSDSATIMVDVQCTYVSLLETIKGV